MKTKHYTTLLATAVALLMAFYAVPAISEDKPADNMEILREKVHADKKLVVATVMELTESEAKGFWPVYDAYQKDLSALGDHWLAFLKEYGEKHGTMTDQEAEELLKDHLSIEEAYLKLLKAYLPKFKAVLPGKKVARYYQLETKIKSAIDYELAANIPLIP